MIAAQLSAMRALVAYDAQRLPLSIQTAQRYADLVTRVYAAFGVTEGNTHAEAHARMRISNALYRLSRTPTPGGFGMTVELALIEAEMAWGLVKTLAVVIGVLLVVSVMTATVDIKREHQRKGRRK